DSGTLVFERDGSLHAMVSYLVAMLQGREPLRAALIALWGDDDLTGLDRVRLLSHVCNHLRDRDIHLVMAPRFATMPSAAFVANLFAPTAPLMHVGVFPTRRGAPLSPPKTWSLLVI